MLASVFVDFYFGVYFPKQACLTASAQLRLGDSTSRTLAVL